MEKAFRRNFNANRNSFNSCMYFDEPADERRMTLRIKVYNKTLAWLQSRTAQMSVGMNLGKIFQSRGCQRRVLKETKECGLSRIEVSYIFSSYEAFLEFFAPDFLQ